MGIKNINMFPTEHMKENLAFMHARTPDGKLSLRNDGHLNKKPLWAKDPADIKSTFNAGGAGCFAKPAEYCQIIATLLNDGVHPGTGSRILKKETVDEMFTNQVCYGYVLVAILLLLTHPRFQTCPTLPVRALIRQSEICPTLCLNCIHKEIYLRVGV